MTAEEIAAIALQDAWDKIETLPPIIFTDHEALAIVAAVRAILESNHDRA